MSLLNCVIKIKRVAEAVQFYHADGMCLNWSKGYSYML